MNFRMIQAVIKCFERSTVERIEENSNYVSRCLYLYDDVNKYTNTAMAKWGTKSWQREETTLRKHGSSAVFNIALKKVGGKKSYHHMGYLYLVTHLSTNPAEQVTVLSGRNMLTSLWYSD